MLRNKVKINFMNSLFVTEVATNNRKNLESEIETGRYQSGQLGQTATAFGGVPPEAA